MTTKKIRKKPGVPKILPREPLTKKARAAIFEYSLLRGGDIRIHYFMVNHVLQAERMRRKDLYAWLEAKGYKWLPRVGFWEKKDRANFKTNRNSSSSAIDGADLPAEEAA